MSDLDDLERYDEATRWPCVMARALGPDWVVLEEGQPGRTTIHDDPVSGPHKNGMRVLPALLETHRPLDLVVIMLGTNDLQVRFSVTAFDISESLKRLGLLVAGSNAGPQGSAPQVMLISPAPVIEAGFLAETFQDGPLKSQMLPARLRKTARTQGWLFMDAGRTVSVDEKDGVHLNAESHVALGKAAAEPISDHFA